MIAATINSSNFIEKHPMNSAGNVYRHANSVRLNPPIPHSHASEIVVLVYLVNEMLLILIPLLLTFWKMAIYR